VNAARETVANLLRLQARYCGVIGSPLYERLLERAAEDALAGGPVWTVLAGHENDPPRSNLALRFVGAVHRSVLGGDAPELAAFYPSVGGVVDGERVWPAFRDAVERLRDELRAEVAVPVQTNEVARSAGLLGGFLLVAGSSGLPLRVLEVGASAGLILRWDDYHYSAGADSWGNPDSPVRFENFLASRR
jgi:hypothetical protein